MQEEEVSRWHDKAGSGDDEILASGEAIYTIYGDRGDDRIIVGTDVENTVFGGSGDDYLEATFGDNTLYGDKGEDTFVNLSAVRQLRILAAKVQTSLFVEMG